MSDPRPVRLPVAAPDVAAPPRFKERRAAARRAADRLAHEETRLLARSLDVLAAPGDAESRLAGLLDLLAATVGARRAAVVADGTERRVAVAASDEVDRAEALALAAWLDAAAPRSRAQRAAAAPAAVSVARRSRATPDGRSTSTPPLSADGAPSCSAPSFACLEIPSAGEVTLGFAFDGPVTDQELATRLPPAMARHAAVALALVTGSLTTERNLAELRAAEVEREHFVSTVAHELRTPLTGLSGYLDLILDGQVEDREIEREFMERGRSIVGSMAALVGDLLDMSRLESGTLALEIRPFSVAEAISSVHAGLVPIALDRGLELRTLPPPRLGAANGDRRRVEQVLTNLAANAIKFGGAAGRVVEIVGWFDGPVAVVAVRDEGDGIDETDRIRIFERFYRMADHARVTGTGLGLPIARELARTMGGDLDVASLRGGGSSFVLVLPGPGVLPTSETIAAALGATLVAETERLRTVAILRAAGEAPDASTSPSVGEPGGSRAAKGSAPAGRLRLGPTAPAAVR
ncbi:MAG TPA: HAMP domain-containing sensor histidine kinase [Candidatus Saccharimonadales bacterium]|nr:HAMP domain-containing sensor histidine kinase [Candidatus Saccharimonadales bacterium]